MANVLYPLWKKALLDGDVALDTESIKAVLVDGADYTYSAAHQYLSDIAAGGRVSTSAALATKTTTGGVFDSADPKFTAVTGDPSEILVLMSDTGNAATSRLIAFYDSGVTGLPVTPNGGDIDIVVNAGGWFAL
jgi:hypothetical protein